MWQCPAFPGVARRQQGPSAMRTTCLLIDLSSTDSCRGQRDKDLKHVQAGSKLFGKEGGGAALYLGGQQECMELCFGVGNELARRLWVRISRQTSIIDVS